MDDIARAEKLFDSHIPSKPTEPDIPSSALGGTTEAPKPKSAADLLFGSTMNTEDEPDRQKQNEDLGVFKPEPKEAPQAEEPEDTYVWSEGLSETQASFIEELGVEEADIEKFDAIVEGLKPNADIDDLIYATKGFLLKYNVSEEQFKAWLADELGGEPETEAVSDDQRAEWRAQAHQNYDENEIQAAALAIQHVYGKEALEKLGASGKGLEPEMLAEAVKLAVQHGILKYEEIK